MTGMDAGALMIRSAKEGVPKSAITKTFDDAVSTVSACCERVSSLTTKMRDVADQVYGTFDSPSAEPLAPATEGAASVLGAALELLSRQIEFMETQTARLCADGS